jgi:hypothetical protein
MWTHHADDLIQIWNADSGFVTIAPWASHVALGTLIRDNAYTVTFLITSTWPMVTCAANTR